MKQVRILYWIKRRNSWTSLATYQKTARTQVAEAHVLVYAPVHVPVDAWDVVHVLVHALLLAGKTVHPLAEAPVEVHVPAVLVHVPAVREVVVDAVLDVADNVLGVQVRATALAVGVVLHAHRLAALAVLELALVAVRKVAEQDVALVHLLADLVARDVLLVADLAVPSGVFLDVKEDADLDANIIALLNVARHVT